MWQMQSTGSADTERIGHEIGNRLRGGEVIELVSDLGGGKTTFVRGLVSGFGSDDAVSSPSFTISQVYVAGARTLHHYDFYRLPDAGIMASEIAEVLQDPSAVVVVEWAGAVENVLPKARIRIDITTAGDETRSLEIHVPEVFAYLKGDV